MSPTKKIKAFTLGEMIIVLILSSIVVGLAFSVLTLVQKQMFGIQTNFKNNTEFSKLETSLWVDFNRYSNITYNNFENELKLVSEMDSISYRFENEYVVKNVDTFPVQLQPKQFFFDGEAVETGVIDAIKLESTKALQNQKLFIFKQNDAAAFMN